MYIANLFSNAIIFHLTKYFERTLVGSLNKSSFFWSKLTHLMELTQLKIYFASQKFHLGTVISTLLSVTSTMSVRKLQDKVS